MLSIVVPCLNEADCIAGTLDTLAPARSRGVEVIVVDGSSSDGTMELARARADAVFSAPRGRAAQMNAGAARARGDVLLFLHADSRLPDRADRAVLDALNDPRAQWGRFDVTIEGTHPLLRVIAAMMNLRSRWSGIATGDQAIFVRRRAFEAVGGFPALPLMEDIALSARLRSLSAPRCLRERVVTSGRRWEKHGVVRTVLLMWRLRLAYALGADPVRLAQRYVPHRQP